MGSGIISNNIPIMLGVDKFPDRIMKIAEWISKRPGYSFRHFELKECKEICQ
jgi:hypothetical protein